MKKLVLSTLTAALMFSSVSIASASASTPQKPTTQAGLIHPNYIPNPDGGSFTLIDEKYKTFDNTYTNLAIGAAFKITLDYFASKYSIKGFWVSGTTSAMGSAVYTALQSNKYVYVKIREGISYNESVGYYNYYSVLVNYSDSSFSTPTKVQYYDTGTRVPSDVLALYGLGNY